MCSSDLSPLHIVHEARQAHVLEVGYDGLVFGRREGPRFCGVDNFVRNSGGLETDGQLVFVTGCILNFVQKLFKGPEAEFKNRPVHELK
mgnify:CR=1 FL=1